MGKQRHAYENQLDLAERATREGGAEGGGENLHGRGGDWTQIYVTKQKESHNVGLLAEVYTSELGAVYMEDPSWFAWHNSTVPTKEREIDGIWSGNRHATPERPRRRKGERQRMENTATPRGALPWPEDSGGSPTPSPPPPLPTTPARHTRIISFQREVGVGGSSCPRDPSFRSVMSAARRAQKGALEISARTSQTSAIQTLLSCVIVVSHCTSLCLGIPTWKTGCIHLPPGRLVNRVTGQVPNAGAGM